jgi:hypothetical protein
MRNRWLRLAVPMLALALVATACGTENQAGSPTDAARADKVEAVDLRSGLTGLLTEHVYLAALGTGSALRGDEGAFAAYAGALNGESGSNTSDLVAAIASIYGDETGTAFEGLWRSEGHIPAVVAYTQAIAKDDTAGASKAVNDLLAYAKTFGETMHSVNENLPAAAVEEGVKHHVTTLKAVIDAQKAKDPGQTYASLRLAYGHMAAFATTLSDATAKKFPDKVDGEATSPAAGLQATLTSVLREHVLLASSATGAALRGDMASFNAAATALNGAANSNTASIVSAVGSVYGAEVQRAFDGLWRSEGHIPAVVAYTQAIAKDDTAGAEKAVNALLAYAETFGETMNSVNENLPADAVEEAITMHATTLKTVIDDQKAQDRPKEAADLRTAVHHMSATAQVLARATVAKFPEKFGA